MNQDANEPAYERLSQQEIKTQASLLRGRYYKGFDHKRAQGTTTFSTLVHTTIQLGLPGFFKKDNEKGMLVQVEISPVGERASRIRAYVPYARDDDPASRLAFRVVAKDPKGVYQTVYPKAGDSLSAIFRANGFVDWMSGATNSVLATRRRRFIYIPENVVAVPEKLKFFIGGGYILDDGSRVKKLSKKRPRSSDSDEEPEPGSKKAAK